MSSTINPDDELLHSPDGMERGDILTLFVRVVNLCEPDHKYDVEYPFEESDIDFSWTSAYWAKCGPRHGGGYFAINMGWAEGITSERMLAVMCHEISHFKYGIKKNQPSHGSDFWEAMAKYALTLETEWTTVQSWFTLNPDVDDFVKEAVNDPNDYLVDGRIETVKERKRKQAELLNRNPMMVIR